MAVAQAGGYLERPRPSGLADVIEIILDKGLVIDAYVRVSLIGIEILTIDARIVIASVDTYLRFAEAVGRLNIAQDDQSQGLPDLLEGMTEKRRQGQDHGRDRGRQGEARASATTTTTTTTTTSNAEEPQPPALVVVAVAVALAQRRQRAMAERARLRRRRGRRAQAGRPRARGTSSHRDVAALVSDLDEGPQRRRPCAARPTGACSRRPPRETTVLPVRFGTAMADETAVRDEFLAPSHDDLLRRLVAMRGKVQLTVKGFYDEQTLHAQRRRRIAARRPPARAGGRRARGGRVLQAHRARPDGRGRGRARARPRRRRWSLERLAPLAARRRAQEASSSRDVRRQRRVPRRAATRSTSSAGP